MHQLQRRVRVPTCVDVVDTSCCDMPSWYLQRGRRARMQQLQRWVHLPAAWRHQRHRRDVSGGGIQLRRRVCVQLL
jgi:hypothetical protein